MDIEAVKAAESAATPGPWVSNWDQPDPPEGEPPIEAIKSASGEWVVGVGWYDGPVFMVTEADARFICMAREAVPDLLRRRDNMLELLQEALAYITPTISTHEQIADVLAAHTGWKCPCGYCFPGQSK